MIIYEKKNGVYIPTPLLVVPKTAKRFGESRPRSDTCPGWIRAT